MSKAEQSSTSASARCSTTSSLTLTVYPAAKTSYPASRSAKLSSSAISGVSSMSRMRRKRILLLGGSEARQPLLLAFAGLQIHHPHSAAGCVVGAAVVLKHRAPGFQRAHRERVSFEVVARVVQHFIRVPVVGEDRVTSMHAQHGVVTVERRFLPYLARGAALLAFADDVNFLRLWSGRGRGFFCFGFHEFCAPVSAPTAAAIFTRFFASAAWIKASGNSTPIIRHCSLAKFCNLAMCSACRWPKRPCNFKYSDTGRMFCGRKL